MQIIESCPSCKNPLAAEPGFRKWCPKCNWNSGIGDTGQEGGWLLRLYLRAGEKSARKLLDQLCVTNPAEFRKHIGAGRQLAALICVVFLLLNVLLAALGVWLLIAFWPNILAIIAGVALVGLSLAQWPKFGTPPRELVAREDFPHLFSLIDRVVAALGAKPLDYVAVDHTFNASMGRVGRAGKSVLTIGLPLFAALPPQPRVALIAHEIGHNVNGDPGRGRLQYLALSTLDRWIDVLMQDAHALSEGLTAFFAHLVLSAVAHVLMAIRYLILRLIYTDSQRAEYFADYLSAKAAGTAPAIALLSTVGSGELIHRFLGTLHDAVGENGETAITRLGRHLNSLPQWEAERLRRCSLSEQAHIDATHPANIYRVHFLEAHKIEVGACTCPARSRTQLTGKCSNWNPGCPNA